MLLNFSTWPYRYQDFLKVRTTRVKPNRPVAGLTRFVPAAAMRLRPEIE
jgi:hypothetical protein